MEIKNKNNTSNKIRIRNLDEEVLKYFRKYENKIVFDDLDEAVIKEIKNGTGTELNQYNDAELRNRIIALENDKLGSEDAENIYLKKEDGNTSDEIDKKIAASKKDLEEKIAFEVDEINQTFIKKDKNVISEEMLSSDLQNKVNARYENKRPDGSSGSGIPESEFNKLKVQVNTNSESIEDLQIYVNTNVVLKDDVILFDQLDTDTQNKIANSRQENIPIEMGDLSTDLQKKLSMAAGDTSEILEEVLELKNSFKGETGQVFYSNYDEEEDIYSIEAKYIFAEDTILINDSDVLESAKEYAATHQIDYIADIQNNILYSINVSTLDWENDAANDAYTFLSGRIVLEYPIKNLYVGTSTVSCTKIVDLSNIIDKIDQKLSLSGGVLSGTVTAPKFITNTGIEIY